MRPRARTRATKDLKENIYVVKKNKVKSDGKITKSSRKALADKTNSLSDDNASIDIPIKTSKKALNVKNSIPHEDDKVRPKRERRLPPRYIQNQTLNSLSNSQDSPLKQKIVTLKVQPTAKKPVKKIPKATKSVESVAKKKGSKLAPSSELPSKETPEKSTRNGDKQVSITKFLTKGNTRSRRDCHLPSAVESPPKDDHNITSPFKTPLKDAENSLFTNRPKRSSRLPSRLEDHSISPSKFIPVQPCHASTPIVQKTSKIVSKKTENISNEKENKAKTNLKQKLVNKPISKKSQPSPSKISTSSYSEKVSPDTNNNGKKVLRPKRAVVNTKLQAKQVSPNNKIKPFTKRLLEKSLSFRVLEDRKSNDKGDVYEFTFDPNDEPTPQKKKRKKPVKKRQPKPKIVIPKSNYNDNVSKTIESLKSKVKYSKTKSVETNIKLTENITKPTENQTQNIENPVKRPENHVPQKEIIKPLFPENVQTTEAISKPPSDNLQSNMAPDLAPVNDSINSIHASNYASIRVEDIAADFEFSDHQNDINYSPVNSPLHQQAPVNNTVPEFSVPITNDPVNTNDPLNLHENPSFFEEPPVASSSMNVSIHHPLASPWRVEFGTLPMRWHNNTYVKANMTPAVESSFVNSEATKKKHVYTNMLLDREPLPEIFDNPPALKQTSIISFIKEVAERNAKKKKRRRSQSLTKAVFNEVTNTEGQSSPKKAKLAKDSTPNTSNNSNTSKDKENSNNSMNKSLSSEKKKKKDKDHTLFGFDDTVNTDQENVSPVKVNPNPKTRVLRSRNVLQELNTLSAPTRAAMPVSKAKLPSSEVVEQLYDQLKSAEDAQLPVKETAKEPVNDTADDVTTNVDDPSWQEDNDDSQSVHLFEDIDVVHHLKPHRKSYGKAKKVTFQRSVDSDSDDQPPARQAPESDDDDLADLSFHLPDVKQARSKRTKKKPKKLLTKKEEKEVEEWAADFNSMCEDIDDFPLVVE